MTFPLTLNKIPNSHSSIQGFMWSVLCYFPIIITYCYATYSIRDISIYFLSLEHAKQNVCQDLCTLECSTTGWIPSLLLLSYNSNANWKVRAFLSIIFKINCFSVPSLPSFALLTIYSKRIAIWQTFICVIIWL